MSAKLILSILVSLLAGRTTLAAPISAPPSSVGAPDNAAKPIPSADSLPVINAQQSQTAVTTKCLNALNEVFGALGDLEKAKCQVTSKMPDCKPHVSCNPTATVKAVDSTGRSATKPSNSAKPKSPAADSASGDSDITPSSSKKSAEKTSSPDTSTTSASNSKSETTPSSSSGNTSGPSDEEQAALDKCQSLASQASSACSDSGDDDSYASAIGDGLTAACSDLQNAGLSSAKKKNDLAKACQTAYMSCAQTCSSSADTYSESDNWSTFNSKGRTCLAFSSRAQEMLKASSTSLDSSKAGTNCLSDSSQSTQSAADNSKSTSSSTAACTGAGCSSATTDQSQQGNQAATATGGFGDASAQKTTGTIDVGDTSSIAENPFGGVDSSQANTAPRVAPIANNSGGSIPGGASAPSMNTQSAGTGLWDAMKSKVTDIQRGLFGGGGYQAPQKLENPDASMGFAGYDSSGQPIYRSKRDPASLSQTKDFKRYLPGGDLFRGIERGPATTSQFHGPYVDIWSRITKRMREKCKLGELYDCQ